MVLALLLSAFPGAVGPAVAVSPDVVISQVYGGGGNSGAPYTHDFIELYNRGPAAVNLSGWSLQYASATGTGNFGATATQITPLSGIIQPGQYLLVQEASNAAVGAPLPTPDITDSSPIAMSATGGKVALANIAITLGCNGGSTPCPPSALASIVDLVGYDGANFFEGSPAPAASNTTAVLRANNGCTDTDNNGADFSAAAPAPRNSASPFYYCSPATNPSGVGAASPASVQAGETSLLTVTVTPGTNPLSSGLAVTADLTAIGGVSAQPFFDDGSNGDLTAGDNIFSFLATVAQGTPSCSKSLPATIGDAQGRSGSATIRLNIIVLATIRDIQGASHLSSFNNQCVAGVTGIVTARRSNGYYFQDPNPDGDQATSEGLFVFTSSAPAVSVGDAVQVSGRVSEFRPGGSGSTNLTTTEIVSPITIIQSSGNPLPAPVVIGAAGRIPPDIVIEDDASGDVETGGVFDPFQDGIDFYESLEGMRVQVDNPVASGPTSAFGELPVLGDGGAYASLRSNRGGIVLRPGDFNPERIFLDDEVLRFNAQAMPLVQVGDGFTGPVVGVLDYSFGNFKLQVTAPPIPVSSGLTRETAAPGAEYQLSVATFNVENLSAASPQSKLDALAAQIVNHLASPDILAVQEVQDNNGATNNGVVAADQTFTTLIAAIQAAGGPVYDFRQIDPLNNTDGGAPGANIRVGFLFNPARVAFVDRPGGDAVTPTAIVAGAAGPELTFSPGRIDPNNPAFTDSRKPLAGEFVFRGDKVFVVVNHFNSKGGDQPLFGRFQPPAFPSEVQRAQQASVLNGFVAQALALDPNANVVVLGDLNDFQFSAALSILKGSELLNLVETLPEAEQYTYVFEGNSQVLDHILLSAAPFYRAPLSYDIVHVNAEFAESDQASDHDPQVAAICVDATPPVISASVTPTVLWPANHKYVPVTAAVSVSDNADPGATFQLVSVVSNEPDNGLGDGDMPDDIVILDDLHFRLRAERSGTGEGRIYTITYLATDACGNTTAVQVTVSVPKSRGK
jgi:hypothetical protein